MFNKYKLMFSYIKSLKENRVKINNYFIENKTKFNYKIQEIKIDKIHRLYTVLNFPEKTTKNIQKYGHLYIDEEVKKFIKEMNNQLKEIGLMELVALSKADVIQSNKVLIVMEYKFLNIGKIAKNIIIIIFSLLIIIFGYFLIF